MKRGRYRQTLVTVPRGKAGRAQDEMEAQRVRAPELFENPFTKGPVTENG